MAKNLLHLRLQSNGFNLPANLVTNPDATGNNVVLFILPIGEERKGAVRVFFNTAHSVTRLENVKAAFFFDPYGDGDAPGDFNSLTWQSWQQNCRDAILYLQQNLHTEQITIVSLRLGCFLACQLAAEFSCISKLCLIQPVNDTGGYLRELRRRSQFRLGDATKSRPANDIDGYVYNQELINYLQASPPLIMPSVGIVSIFICTANVVPANFRSLADSWSAPLISVPTEPFWLETDQIGCPPMQQALTDYIATFK